MFCFKEKSLFTNSSIGFISRLTTFRGEEAGKFVKQKTFKYLHRLSTALSTPLTIMLILLLFCQLLLLLFLSLLLALLLASLLLLHHHLFILVTGHCRALQSSTMLENCSECFSNPFST